VVQFSSSLFLYGSFFSTPNCAIQDIHTTGTEGTNFIVFGKETRSYNEIRLNTSMPPIPITKNQEYLKFDKALHFESCGRSIATGGDFNKDRRKDLLIGDPFNSKVYLLFGSENGFFLNVTNGFVLHGPTTTATTTTSGEASDDYFGWAVSNTGDFNDDGYDDLIISALLIKTCFIVYGKNGHFKDLSMNQLTVQDGFSVKGSSSMVQTGLAVSSAGDFNGDGIDDIAISAMGRDNGNVVYILYGSRTKPNNNQILLDNLNSWRGVKITAPAFSFMGYGISWLGDINGDGFDDLIIGSIPYGAQAGFQAEQISYVIYGKDYHRQSNHTSLSIADLEELNLGMKLIGGGLVVNGLGDVNGDGLNDVLVTSFNDWQGKNGGGAAILVEFPSFDRVAPSSGPTDRPSSQPSGIPTVHSNQPTSSPSSATVTTRRPSFTVTPPPSRRPTLPTVSPSFSPSSTPRPSFPPSLVPSKSFRPSFVPRTHSPSIKSVPTRIPTRIPTKVPSLSLSPSGVPTLFPTFSTSTISSFPKCSKYINETGSFHGCNETINQFFIRLPRESLAVTLTGNGTINKYVLFPRPNCLIRITNFQIGRDLLDLSSVPGVQEMSEINYSLPPLTILLPNNQTVEIMNLQEFDLSVTNFVFSSKNETGTNGDGSTGPAITMNSVSAVLLTRQLILSATALLILLGGTLYCSRLNSNPFDSKTSGKALKAYRETKRKQQLLEFPLTSGNQNRIHAKEEDTIQQQAAQESSEDEDSNEEEEEDGEDLEFNYLELHEDEQKKSRNVYSNQNSNSQHSSASGSSFPSAASTSSSGYSDSSTAEHDEEEDDSFLSV
jgi:hypothetical protein